MKLENIARTYVSCVELEEKLRAESPDLGEELSELRADLHSLLMEALRENHIDFADRAHAAQIAFQMTKTSALPTK